MKLNGEQMEAVVSLVDQHFGYPELRRIVRFKIDQDLDDIAGQNMTKIGVIFQIVDWSMRRQCLERLLEGFAKENGAIKPALDKIVEEAMRAETVAPNGAARTPADPLARYFFRDQPLIDREELENQLGRLWGAGGCGVLIVRGDRYTGRSHSWWRVREVADRENIAAHYIDLSSNPGEWTTEQFVDRVASFLDLPEVFDNVAQGSYQGKMLVRQLNKYFGTPNVTGKRWCLVLDGLDRLGIATSIVETVDRIVEDVLALNLRDLSVVILGYGDNPNVGFAYNILEERLRPIESSDVERYLHQVAGAVGRTVQPLWVSKVAQEVFNGLAPPLDHSKMSELKSRVKRHAIEVLRRTS
jgi:hypothetical protein